MRGNNPSNPNNPNNPSSPNDLWGHTELHVDFQTVGSENIGLLNGPVGTEADGYTA